MHFMLFYMRYKSVVWKKRFIKVIKLYEEAPIKTSLKNYDEYDISANWLKKVKQSYKMNNSNSKF